MEYAIPNHNVTTVRRINPKFAKKKCKKLPQKTHFASLYDIQIALFKQLLPTTIPWIPNLEEFRTIYPEATATMSARMGFEFEACIMH